MCFFIFGSYKHLREGMKPNLELFCSFIWNLAHFSKNSFFFSKYGFCFCPPCISLLTKIILSLQCYQQIVNNYRASLSTISWFVCGEQIIVIDLQDTDKSRYFAITEFNNCKKEKSTVSVTLEQNIICSQTLLDGIADEQTIICRELFAGHMVGFRPVKRKKNLFRMIINFDGMYL